MSNDWFDTLAKDSARGLSRRQMFGRLLGGTGMAVLTVFGLRQLAADNDCGKLCKLCCHNAFPDHGPGYGQCISDCHHGEGLCGAAVCPD